VVPDRVSVELAGVGRVGLLEFGAPDGVPALYFHGTPSSAFEAHWLHLPAVEAGVRIVAVDRLGYHQSPPVSEADAGARVYLELSNLFGFDRFAVVGFSGGANIALAVAAAAPDRVTVAHLGGALGSLASLRCGELGRARSTMFRAMTSSRGLAKTMLRLQRHSLRKNVGAKLATPTYAAFELLSGAAAGAQLPALENYVRRSSPADLAAFVEGYMRGADSTDGLLADLAAFRQPITFDRITVPVELWHGTKDRAIPIAAARVLAAELPNATLHELEGEGHFVLLSHGGEVCTAIACATQEAVEV
jgi:pimeloyl-ACP methyl ester carboxylesterase